MEKKLMGPIWRYRATVIAWPILGLATVVLLDHTTWTFPTLLGEMVALGLYSRSISCPKCGKPVGRTGILFNPFAPSRCGQCGHNLK
jgi:hypothetical protein